MKEGLSVRIALFSIYFFNHLSSQPKKVLCQRIPFCGFNTQ